MIVHSTDFKTNLGKYLDKLCEEDIYILRNGKPAAKIIEYTHLSDVDLLMENAAVYDYSPRKISYEDFIEQSEKTEERLEYIDGRVYAMGSPSHTHQKIIMHFCNIFLNHFKGMKCQPYVSPYDIHFISSDNKACVQPDIFIMCDEENVIDDKYYGVPAMIVEVVSKSTRTRDTMIKLNLYWREGVSEYLLVDPINKVVHYWYFKDKELVIHKELSVEDVFESNVFNGLKVTINELF